MALGTFRADPVENRKLQESVGAKIINGGIRQNKRFKRSVKNSGNFLSYPIKAGPNENIGDRLRIKCV